MNLTHLLLAARKPEPARVLRAESQGVYGDRRRDLDEAREANAEKTDELPVHIPCPQAA